MGGFFWFLIGAGTATIWSKHHEERQQYMHGYYANGCHKRIAPAPVPSSPSREPPAPVTHAIEEQPQPHRGGFWGRQAPAPAPAPAPPVEQQQQPPRYADQNQTQTPWFWGPPPQWSQEDRKGFFPKDDAERRERFEQFKTQAGDAMTELSESTLDTLMATIQAAKSKLADRRLQKEVEEKRQFDAMNSGSRR